MSVEVKFSRTHNPDDNLFYRCFCSTAAARSHLYILELNGDLINIRAEPPWRENYAKIRFQANAIRMQTEYNVSSLTG